MSEEKPKRRLITFADIAARSAAPSQAPARPPDPAPAAEAPERATYARLVSLSKRPEDFRAAAPAAPEPSAPETSLHLLRVYPLHQYPCRLHPRPECMNQVHLKQVHPNRRPRY